MSLSIAAPTEEQSGDNYAESLKALPEGSVQKHFDPYVDIDWDSPEFAVTPNDRRWILPEHGDPLGAHPWYQALPIEKKIEIGMWRQANVAKVGLQFETVLIGGLMQHVFPVSRAIWKICKIDGRPSRYRSEPSRVPVRASA
jgi:hypothetical protein